MKLTTKKQLELKLMPEEMPNLAGKSMYQLNPNSHSLLELEVLTN
jgi:hypothetical protein